jgi:prevent-host-death family protein
MRGLEVHSGDLAPVHLVPVEVAISELRAHLSEWLEQARDGKEVVITDRGMPVARLLGISATATLERLSAEGVIARPGRAQRPIASGRPRPPARQSVAELVSEQRR